MVVITGNPMIFRLPRVVVGVVHVARLSHRNVRLWRHHAGLEALDRDCTIIVVVLWRCVDLLARGTAGESSIFACNQQGPSPIITDDEVLLLPSIQKSQS
uniref:Uncharacterized protein n=1 Tax=Arundo donax TaxID=35708 RepID=A0A0A9HPP7_ARUDO